MAFSDRRRVTTKLVMVRVALGLAITAVAARPAFADVTVAAGAPFTRAELTDALARRGAAPGDVAVSVVSPTAVELRTAVGRQRVELGDAGFVAGPELGAYSVSSKAQGLTAGAGGGVRVRVIGGAGWHAVAGADIDGFLHRVAVERNHMQFAATPRVALTGALGLVWGGR